MGASVHGAAPALARSSGDSAANASVGAAESLAPVADLALVDIISSLSENDDPAAIENRTATQGVRDVRGRDRQTLLRRLASRSDQIHIREKLEGKWKDRKLTDIEADVKKMLSAAAKDFLAGIRRGARVAEEVPSATAASSTARNHPENRARAQALGR